MFRILLGGDWGCVQRRVAGSIVSVSLMRLQSLADSSGEAKWLTSRPLEAGSKNSPGRRYALGDLISPASAYLLLFYSALNSSVD